jgi:hypothetical protein
MAAADVSRPDCGRRVLRFLSGGPASVLPAAGAGKVLLEAAGRGSIAVDADVLALLVSRGVLLRTSHSIALSGEGMSLARQLASSAQTAGSDDDIGLVSVETAAGASIVLANLAESPLAQLVRRKGKDGRPFLSSGEFEAGERLRADYTRGRIMPRLGANWIASVASGKRGSPGGCIADLTDAALAARQRVENAIAAVGPELSGVLIDVCCFLKGLERVETERGWPVRSAKIVLKTALGVLARHYLPAKPAGHRRPVLHWGAEDYRPTIG